MEKYISYLIVNRSTVQKKIYIYIHYLIKIQYTRKLKRNIKNILDSLESNSSSIIKIFYVDCIVPIFMLIQQIPKV